jgi:hypothetical protein
MSLDNQRVVIETHFGTQFAISYPSTPVEYEGTDFDEPTSGVWVKLRIITGDSQQANLGINNIVERFSGFIQCEIVTPKGDGLKLPNEIKETIGRIFSRQQLSSVNGDITFKTPSDMGHVQEEEKLVSIVRVSFIRNTRY